MKNIAKIISSLILILLFSYTAFAQTPNTDSQAVILQLQEQIKVLEAKIVEIQTELKATKSELVEVKEQLQLARTLRRGMTGEDVKQLQEFLKQFSDIYPEGLVTGFFGPLTETAVKRFQEKREIVSSGSPETTGFGQVGPRTISKLNELVVQVGAGSPGKTSSEINVAPGNSNNPTEQASQLTVTPISTPITPTSTPSGTIPATPAVPATTSSGGTGTPATSATPAVPATPNQPSPQTSSSSSSSSQDTTPPIISNVQTTNIAETSATTTWTTDELASSEVYYALSSPITATSTIKIIGADNVTNHGVNLTGLSSSKIYYYVVVSKDSAGNTATSSEQSFTTLMPPPPPSPVSSWSNVQITNFSGNGNIYYGEYPAIAWSGSGYGVVWEGHDGDPNQGSIENIFFARLDQNGNMVGSPVRLSNHGYCGCLTAYPPNIAWNGSNYGVVWGDVQFVGGESGGDISGNYLRLVTLNSDGNKLTDNLVSSYGGGAGVRPGIKVDGNNFIVSSTEYTPAFSGRVFSSGGKIYFNDTDTTNELVSTVSGSNSYPHINWTGSKYIIVWMNVQNNQLQLYFGIK